MKRGQEHVEKDGRNYKIKTSETENEIDCPDGDFCVKKEENQVSITILKRANFDHRKTIT